MNEEDINLKILFGYTKHIGFNGEVKILYVTDTEIFFTTWSKTFNAFIGSFFVDINEFKEFERNYKIDSIVN